MMGRLLTGLKSIVSMLPIFRPQAKQENDHMTEISFDLDNVNRIRAKNGKVPLTSATASDVAANAADAGVDIEQALTGYIVVEAPFGDAPVVEPLSMQATDGGPNPDYDPSADPFKD